MPKRITIHEEDYARLLEMEKEDAGLILQNLIRTLEGIPPEIKGDAYIDYFSEVACQKMMRFAELSERQARNGSKGGAPFGNSNRKQPKNNPDSTQKQPKTTPNTNTNTNTITNIKDIASVSEALRKKNAEHMKEFSEILDYLNEKAGTHYRHSKESDRFINARISEGYTVENFKTVIDKKVKEWKGTEMAAYLRPSTLFAAGHFEEYLNAPEIKIKPGYSAGERSDNPFNRFTQRDIDFSELEKGLIKN